MFNLKETVEFFGKAVRLGVLFEVVDDPEDHSKYFNYAKAIDVWLFAGKEKIASEFLTLDKLQQKGLCIHNITKSTPVEFRKYAIHTFDNGYLHIVATPTAEWEDLYQPRVYNPIAVKSGRIYNFAVSVPPKLPPTNADNQPLPQQVEKRFNI